MDCGNVGFGLSGGEEAGNVTKVRAVYGQFQLLGQIKKNCMVLKEETEICFCLLIYT